MFARSIARLPVLTLLLIPSLARAQYLTRPSEPYETITTPSFRIHYPAAMREWVKPVAERLESYAAAVQTWVGSKPSSRTTVMVDDPSNVSNGFALPLLESPTIFLWPTPPTPGPTFGTHRGWGEILAVHEYAHIAHLTIPSRNAGERALWSLLPVRLGPLARKSPSWVIEGYATYLEGKLTGSGRPGSVGRAAVLRQWALEGQLPKYGELNSTSTFYGGAMRYLVGSAFLEWLAVRKGDESLRHLWRRMSAAKRRSFGESFRGVYGASPEEMYGAFYTEVMESAFEARRALRQAGLAQGELIQRLSWGTGGPAISKDGSMIAVVLRSPRSPSRVVIWSTADEGVDSSTAWARRRLVADDSLDVAPIDSFPAPKRALATLYPSRGRGHDAPRWFADGERLLVSRDEPLGDGASRPDLFIWNRKGGVRRVTHGAGIRSADPAPDGKTAVGVRCALGICDVVRIDLDRGSWNTIAAGTPHVVWHQARLSPDGKRVAAAVQRNGVWGVSVFDANGGAERPVAWTGTSARYAPSWAPDGRLVVVSEAGGVANLETLEPVTGEARPLTQVTGSVSSPDVGPDGRVWFLNMHARGFDLRRLAARSASPTLVTLDARFGAVAPRGNTQGIAFKPTAIEGPTNYAFGPRGWRILPGVNLGPDGDQATLMIGTIDPIARWSTLFQGAYGQRGSWRGGSAMTSLRSTLLHLEGSLWYADHAPSKQRSGTFASLEIDSRYTGLGLGMKSEREKSLWGGFFRTGGSVGQVTGNQLDASSRVFGYAEAAGRLSLAFRGMTVSPQVRGSYTQGSTKGDSWTRRVITASLALGGGDPRVKLSATKGDVTASGPGEFGRAFEQFTVGGTYLPFIDNVFLSQRVSLPSVPVGYSSGEKFELYRAQIRAFGVQPYAVWVSAGDSVTHYQRVLGVEREFSVSAIGFGRLPSTTIRAGIGYSMDKPYDEKIRPYVSVTYRP